MEPAIHQPVMETVHLWSGILCVRGQFACRVQMLSDASWIRPIIVYVIPLATCDEMSETCLNLTFKVNLEKGRRWLYHLDQLKAKSEVYQDGWYIAAARLHSVDGREQFQKIVTYLERNSSLAAVKVGEGFLLLATEKQINQQLDVERIKNDETPFLYCICLSRQPIIIHRGKKPLRNCTFPVASQEMDLSHQEYADLEISPLIPLSSYLHASNIKEVFSVPNKNAVGVEEDPISSVSLCHGDVAEGKDFEYNDKRSISCSRLSTYSLRSASKMRKTAHVHIHNDIEDGNDKSSAKSCKKNWQCHLDWENKQVSSLVGANKRTRTNSAKEHISQNNDTFIPIKHKTGSNASFPTSKRKWNVEISCPVTKEKNAKKGRIKTWVKANRGKCVSTSSLVAASLTYALAGQESIQSGVPREVITLKKIPKKNRVIDRFLELTEKHCTASEVDLELHANQDGSCLSTAHYTPVVSPGMMKQERPCKVNSATSLDVAPTEEASIFTKILHDNKVDLDNKRSGLDFFPSTRSEADRLERKEAVRTVRMAKTLQCHIVNNITTSCKFPYIEDNLCHTVKAVLQGPTSGYRCSDVESLIYQSVSSSLHGNHSDGKIFMKKVRVDMTSIQSIHFGDILVDLHLSSNIACGESDGQADSTVDVAKCEGTGKDLVYRKMRSEEDDPQEELDVHRIIDRHHIFPGKEQDASGEDDVRNVACILLQSEAMPSNEGKNTPCEIISTDSKRILPLIHGENASHLTSESRENNKVYTELNGISDTTPMVDSRVLLQGSNNKLAVGSDQSLGNNKWLELKAEAEAVHEILFGEADLASSNSSLSQAAHFHKPLKVNYASLQQQQQTEVSSIESRCQHDEICDRSVIGASFSTSSVSKVHSVAQSENYPCVSSSQLIKIVQKTQLCLPSLSVAITSSCTPSITTSAEQCDKGSQVNKSESLTAVAINTLSQGNSVSRSSESENKVKNSKMSLTVAVTMHSSAAGPSTEIAAPLQSLKDDRSKASSHEQMKHGTLDIIVAMIKGARKALLPLRHRKTNPSVPRRVLQSAIPVSQKQKAGRSRKSEDSKRSHRQFHPYKKQEKKRKDPSCSFDTPYRDLAELLQNLTSKTYKQSSKSPRMTHSWNRSTSQPSRFSSFRFCRSDVPLSLPRSGSPSREDDLNSLTPVMIPNFEERHRTAELLEELFASRNEETYNKEECTYQREQHDIPDDLLPAPYPVSEKSKMSMVIKDDTELSFSQDQTDLLLPGSRTTLFSRTLLSDMSVADEDKIEVDSRGTDIHPMDEDMNDHKDRNFPQEKTTQMQDKNDEKNTNFQSRSLVKSPGLDSDIAMDGFPNVMSVPMSSQHGYLHQHASKTELDSSVVKEGTPCISQCNNHASETELDSSVVKEGTPCISQCNNHAEDKKSEELSRQQISSNCLDNVNMNAYGCSEKLVMEDGNFVNYVTTIIDGKQIQSTYFEKETHQTQTPLKYFQRTYEETKSQGCSDLLQQELTQIECQNSVSRELTDNNPKRSCFREKREETAEESGMQQQNQVLATANIGSNRDSVGSMTAKSAQGKVHENEIEQSNTAGNNSKSHHSYAGRTLTNRNVFSFFETKFLKNEDDSAIDNIFYFSPTLVDSKQRSVELETVTRKEVSASELRIPNSNTARPLIAKHDVEDESSVGSQIVSRNLELRIPKSNTARSLIAKHDLEDESSVGSQIVSRNSELRIPEVDAATDNESVNQCQIFDLGPDVNGEICSPVKRQQVHCRFYSTILSDSQKRYNKNATALETQGNQDHIRNKEQCKTNAEEKDGNSHGSLEVAHSPLTIQGYKDVESQGSKDPLTIQGYKDVESQGSKDPLTIQGYKDAESQGSKDPLTIQGYKDAESQGSKDPLTIQGYKDVESQGSKDPLTIQGYKDAESQGSKDPLTIQGYKDVESQGSKDPLTVQGYKDAESQGSKDPLTIQGYRDGESQGSKDPLTIQGYKDVESQGSKDPLTVQGYKDVESQGRKDPLTVQGYKDAESQGSKDPLTIQGYKDVESQGSKDPLTVQGYRDAESQGSKDPLTIQGYRDVESQGSKDPLTIQGYKDVESQGSKDSANEDKMLQTEMKLTCRHMQLVDDTQKFAEQTVSSPVKDNNFEFSYPITSAFKGKEVESALEDYLGKLSDKNELATGCKIQTVKWNTIATTPTSTNDSIKGVKELNKALLNVIKDMDSSRQVCLTHQDVGLDKNLSNLKDFNPGLMLEFQQVETQVSSDHQVQDQCFSCSQKSLESSVTKAEMPSSPHSAYNDITPWDSSCFSQNHEFCVIQSGSCKEDLTEAETSDCSQLTQDNICSNSKLQGGDEVLKQSNGTLSNIVKESDTVQIDSSVGLGIDKVSCEHASFSESNGVKNTCSDTGLEISGVHRSWSWIYDASNIKPSVDNESATCFATPVYLMVKPTQIAASFVPSVNKIKEMSSSGQQDKIIQHSDATVIEHKIAALNPKENSVVFNMDCTSEAAIKDGNNSKLSLSAGSCKKSYNRNAKHATNANTLASKLGPQIGVDGKNKKLSKSRIYQYPDLKLIGSKKNEFPIKVSTAWQNIQTATPSLISKEIKSARVKCFGENIMSSAGTERRSNRDDKKSSGKSSKVKKGSSKIDLELKKFYDEVEPLLNCGKHVVPEEKCDTQLPKETLNPYKSLVINLQELMKKPASKTMNEKSAEDENNVHGTIIQYMVEESIHKNSADVANTQKMSMGLSGKDKNYFFLSSMTPLEMISSNYSPEEEGDLEKANGVKEYFGAKSNHNLLTLVELIENDLCQGANDTSNKVQESCDLTLTGVEVVTSCISSKKHNHGTSDVSCTYTCKSSNVIDEILTSNCSPGNDAMPEIHHCDPSLLAGNSKQQSSLLTTKTHTSALHSIFSNYDLDDLEENGPDTVSPSKQSTRESISNDLPENIIKTSAKGNLAPKGDSATSNSTHDHHSDQVITTQQDLTVKRSDKDPLTHEQEVRMANAFLSSVSRIACDHPLILNGLEKSDENHELDEYTASNISVKTKGIACSIENIDPNPNTCSTLRTRDDFCTDNNVVSVQTDEFAQADDNKYKMQKSEESASSKGHSDRAVSCTNTKISQYRTNAYSEQRPAESSVNVNGLFTQHYQGESHSADNEDTIDSYAYEPHSSQDTLFDEICIHAQRKELQDTQFLQSKANDLDNGKLVTSGCKLAFSKMMRKDREEEEKAMIGSFVEKELKEWSYPQYLNNRHLKYPEVDRLSKNPEVDRLSKYPEDNRHLKYPEVDRLSKNPEDNRHLKYPEVDRLSKYPEVDRLSKYPEDNRHLKYPEVDRLSKNPEVDRLSKYPDVDRLSKYPEDNRHLKYPEVDRLSKYPEVDRLSKYPEDNRLSKNPEVDRLSKYPEVDRLSKNPEDNRHLKYPEVDRLSKNPEDNRHLKYPEVDRLSKNPEDNRHLKYPEVDRLSKNPEDDRLSKNPEVDRLSKNSEDDRLSKNPEVDRLSKNLEDDRLSKNLDSYSLSENLDIDGLHENVGNDMHAEDSDNGRLSKHLSILSFPVDPDKERLLKQSLNMQVSHGNNSHHLPKTLSSGMNISGQDSAVKQGSEIMKDSSSITSVCSDDNQFSETRFIPLKKENIVKKTWKIFSGFKSSKTCFLSQKRQKSSAFENFMIRKDKSGKRVFFVSQSRTQTQKGNLYSGVCDEKLFAPGVFIPDVRFVATKMYDTKVRGHQPACRRYEPSKSERKLVSEDSFQSVKRSKCAENLSSCLDILSKNSDACSGNKMLKSPHEDNELSVQINSDTQEQYRTATLDSSENRIYKKSIQSNYNEVRKVRLDNGTINSNSCTSLVSDVEIYSPSQYSTEHHDKENNVSLDSSKVKGTGYYDIVTVANKANNMKCKLPKEFLAPCEPQYNHKSEQSIGDSVHYRKPCLQMAGVSVSMEHADTGDSHGSHSVSSDEAPIKTERNSSSIYVNGKDAVDPISASHWSKSSHQELCSPRASVRPYATETSLRNRHSEKLLKQLECTTEGFVLLDDSIIKPGPKTAEELSKVLQALQGIITNESLWIVGIHAVQICNLAEQRLSKNKRVYADQLLSLFSSFRQSCLVKLLQNHICDAMEVRMTSDLVKCAKTLHVTEGLLHAYVLTTADVKCYDKCSSPPYYDSGLHCPGWTDTEDDLGGVRICSLQTFTDLLQAMKKKFI